MSLNIWMFFCDEQILIISLNLFFILKAGMIQTKKDKRRIEKVI
ncbi:hypothetical protein SMU107_04895 [Streptococcus mutans R221]|nr:hypothetical protein SMU107_04895 [Streptococcus mutans R221]